MLEELVEMASALPGCGNQGDNRRVDCCCPLLPVFIFRNVNCVNIFNGACEDWRPGGPCSGALAQ